MEPRDPRFIPIEGSLNFRDFGGYRTTDGGTVKKGKLFRCGALSYIPESAYDDFGNLKITVICDLRREDEAENAPTPLANPFHCRVHIPIAPGSSFDLRASFEDPTHTFEHRLDYMQNITREIARDHIQEYRLLFEELLNTPEGFLLHCSAGKDRTGFGAAMILGALGVPEDHIFDDYLLTNSANELFDTMLPKFRENYGDRVDEESLRIVAGVRKEYLEAALEEVHRQFGSVEGYLDEAGVDDKARQELRRRYVQQ